MLHVDRHTETIGNLSIRRNILIHVQPCQSRDVQPHIPSLRFCGIGICVVLSHAKYGGPDLVCPLRGAMNEKVGPHGYFYAPKLEASLSSWGWQKLERRKLVAHSLDRMKHVNGIAGIVLAQGRFGIVAHTLPEHFFRGNKGIHVAPHI